MKFTISALSLAALAPLSSAFPTEALRRAQENPELAKRAAEIYERQNAGTVNQYPETFSPEQLIDVSGAHAFVPPGPNDQRGPCPGLNALANHGYLPHDGYASISQFIDTTYNVVGMGRQLGGFLAVYGAALDGSGTAWSIGGTPTDQTIGLNDPLGNTGQGITNSHNNYEADASPTRPDLYQAGENYKVIISQFQQLFDMQPNAATANYDIEVLTQFRSQRFDTQKETNPYFFNGPFTGVLVQPAAYTFIYRFMANHSAAEPDGTLNQDVLKSWFAISGESGSFTYKEGWERIPDNWYRRSLDVPYDVEYYMGDVIEAASKYPKFLDIGGNTGTPNSFAGLDVENLTGGVYNLQALQNPNKLACYMYQLGGQFSPDLLVSNDSNINNYAAPYIKQLNCPQLAAIDANLLKQYPGYQRSS